uniref:Probable 3-oxoacyl-[acyl-carrier-protein] reductase oxidoreductase (EC) n=1 Tax=Ganoderma boninense TaxID=34458 RepID=A0A5K1JZM5_9APHY|nr:Probable 3-oxoacyl-[acyl-carrier-protein] reductase oxidoreductase (EC [Ganoderma boninense]
MESLVALPSLSLPELLSRIKEAFTCGGVGLVVGTAVYGITLFQAYIYFHNSGHDSIRMKSFVSNALALSGSCKLTPFAQVALLFILDTISLILAVDACYEYVVADFGNALLLLNIPRSLALSRTPCLGPFGVQPDTVANTASKFLTDVVTVSNGNIALVGSIIVFALGSFAPSIGLTKLTSRASYMDTYIFSLGSTKSRILTGVVDGLSVLCDMIIVIALSYYLHSKRTGFKRTNSMIDRLIIYAVNRGVLTTVCQAGHLISFVALPGRFIFLVFALLEGKRA